MHEPDDFGLSGPRTLMFADAGVPPPGFTQFWMQWSERVWSESARLEPFDAERSGEDPGAPGVTHCFRSLGDVRIGCRLVMPESAPLGIVVESHGYAMGRAEPLTDETPWRARGLAVLKVRLRGFPGSQMDCGDLTARDFGYLSIGLHDRDTWILNGAAADLVNALRAARDWLPAPSPVMLHGESFGAGLGVLAASQLAGRLGVSRIVLALPSLACWPWRLARRPHAGAGLDVWRFIDAHRGSEEPTLAVLRLFDAAVHARRVRAPVLCKLAERDDVVPAPTAAAVFNNLGTDPGMKWRYVTRYGHFDGGLTDARRHALFARRAAEFLDPDTDLSTFEADPR